MLEVTQTAVQHMVETRSQKGIDSEAGARFAPNAHGIGMAYTRSAQPGDSTVDTPQIDIYVAPELAQRFDNGTLDVDVKEGKMSLVFRPRAKTARPS